MTDILHASAENQKLRGGYYTPGVIARFLASWAIQKPSETILEPSCGDGGLLEAAAGRLLELGMPANHAAGQIQAIELYESEAQAARARLRQWGLPGDRIVSVGDFFDYDDQAWGYIGRKFDVVIGNPPFLRYHSFPEEQRVRAFRIMQTAGLNPTRLTNSWVPFLIAASLRLTASGRLAMVIPAELLQVKYAEETRAFLARHFGAITIVTFRRLVFDGIQQEVVLLLAEKCPEIESGIDVLELDDADNLHELELKLRERHHLKAIDHAEEKWTQYYLDDAEIALLRQAKQHPDLLRFGQIGCVDVGVVTGNNAFFVLSEARIQQWGLQGHTLPLVGRTAQLPGLTYSQEEWEGNRSANVLCHLLDLPAAPFAELPEAGQRYVLHGESGGVHTGFKCRNRRLWYRVPSLWSPDAFLFRQIHEYPKLVKNGTPATSTDTIHRVRFHQPEQADRIIPAFMNSMTFAFAEVIGRSYGGGVLELEPNEAELLPLPPCAACEIDLPELDRLARAGSIQAILDITDEIFLKKLAGFDSTDRQRFRNIWRKLSARRIGRKATRIERFSAQIEIVYKNRYKGLPPHAEG